MRGSFGSPVSRLGEARRDDRPRYARPVEAGAGIRDEAELRELLGAPTQLVRSYATDAGFDADRYERERAER